MCDRKRCHDTKKATSQHDAMSFVAATDTLKIMCLEKLTFGFSVFAYFKYKKTKAVI